VFVSPSNIDIDILLFKKRLFEKNENNQIVVNKVNLLKSKNILPSKNTICIKLINIYEKTLLSAY